MASALRAVNFPAVTGQEPAKSDRWGADLSPAGRPEPFIIGTKFDQLVGDSHYPAVTLGPARVPREGSRVM